MSAATRKKSSDDVGVGVAVVEADVGEVETEVPLALPVG